MKTSFEKFMASSAVNKVELSAMSIELGVVQDAQKAQLDAITAQTQVRKSLETLRNDIAIAKKYANNAVLLYDKAKKDAKSLGMDTGSLDTPSKVSQDLFKFFDAISKKLIGLGK
jgi:hypothetical protein